ncbi:hypothetical protein CDO26_19265 (plasmid) [Sinorhizobium meliloti]|nr:hypothetical protein CDO26_19265 [Sinorhizobium meliloti]
MAIHLVPLKSIISADFIGRHRALSVLNTVAQFTWICGLSERSVALKQQSRKVSIAVVPRCTAKNTRRGLLADPARRMSVSAIVFEVHWVRP